MLKKWKIHPHVSIPGYGSSTFATSMAEVTDFFYYTGVEKTMVFKIKNVFFVFLWFLGFYTKVKNSLKTRLHEVYDITEVKLGGRRLKGV